MAPARLRALESLQILDTPPEEGFDDIVHLAASACEAPVALVSLVAGDRQWFKARVGFPRCETALDSSVCAHALVEPDLLVIGDLALDPRTCFNPLVVGEPSIRFYAGAPLRTRDGHVIGSLCVIDLVPRPVGLTEKQASDLRALARQVMSQIELRRLLRERDDMVAAQQTAAAMLQSQSMLLRTITDHVGQAIIKMDDRGLVTFVNPASERMFGWSRDEMIGQSVHDLIHHTYPDGRHYPAEDCPLRQALVDGRLLVDAEEQFFHRDGTPRDALVSSAPVKVDGIVTGAVATISDITRRKRAEARLAESEAYWRGLFERLEEGLVIGEILRDADGHAVDWRYIDVNPAWSNLTGLAGESTVGRTVRELLPDIEDEWIDEPGHVVDTGESVTFTRRVGQLSRWFEGRVSKLRADTFILLFLDVSERVAIERASAAASQRKAALAQLGDHLRATMSADAMGYTVGAIVGKILGATQAAYATVDNLRETLQIDTSWRAPGVAGLEGSYRLRDYGSFVEDLQAGRTVVIADVGADERTRGHAAAFAALGVRGLINVPVVEQGVLVAIVLATFRAPHTVAPEEEEFVRAAADRTRAGIARIRADERQALVNGEISHRLKNTLAMVQAIANQTLKGASDRDAVNEFDQRLMALSTAHDVLLQKDWDTADLVEVLRRVMDAAGAAEKYDLRGSSAALGPRAALSTSLLVHELVTNATKYGALSQDGGKVDVDWRIEGEGPDEELVLDWREIGGPPAVEPTRRGFGSRLLKMGLVGTGGSSLRYEPTGFEATFRAPRTQIEQS